MACLPRDVLGLYWWTSPEGRSGTIPSRSTAVAILPSRTLSRPNPAQAYTWFAKAPILTFG